MSDLSSVMTHQSEFTRGYWVGQAVAYAYTWDEFTFRMPRAHVDSVTEALRELAAETKQEWTYTPIQMTTWDGESPYHVDFVEATYNRTQMLDIAA